MKTALTSKTFSTFPTIIHTLFDPLDVNTIFDEWPLDFKFGTDSCPYDLEKTEYGFRVTVALAGFSKDEISVKINNDKILEIMAEKKTDTENSNKTYIHKKISYRNKKLTFPVVSGSEISASLKDGLLTVDVYNPKKIEKKENVKVIDIS